LLGSQRSRMRGFDLDTIGPDPGGCLEQGRACRASFGLKRQRGRKKSQKKCWCFPSGFGSVRSLIL
jgi:hypothetical protein